MNQRMILIFNACYLSLQECHIKGIKDKKKFINLALQFGSHAKITKKEIELIFEKSIKDLLEL